MRNGDSNIRVCFFKNKLRYKNKSVILFLQTYIVYISLGRRPVNLYYYNATWFSKDTKLLKKIKFNKKKKTNKEEWGSIGISFTSNGRATSLGFR